jgi:hypothetical protein
MSLRDVILQAVQSSKTMEPNVKVMRCVTAAVDYPNSAASYRRPGYTWVKEWGQARVFEVFNPTGKNSIEMPVLVQNVPKAPFMKAISGVDWETLVGNLNADIGTGGGIGGNTASNHWFTHEWYDGYKGLDAFRVYMRQIASMQAFVAHDLTLQILPGTYLYQEEENSYIGGYFDLTTELPAAGNCVRVTVYYDPSDVTIKSVSSAELPIGGNPAFTFPPKYTLPIVWVYLEDGDSGTTLEESRLYDARALWYIRGLHADDHAEGGDDELDFADLNGITISSPADNEVLAYDTGSGDFINQTPAEAGLSAVGHTHIETDITDLDHDAQKIKGISVDAPNAGNDGQVIYYDDGASAFKYKDAGGGGGGGGGDLYWYVDGVLAAATGLDKKVIAPYDMTITNVILNVKTTGSAGNTTVDININGASIFSVPPSIAWNDPDGIVEILPDTVDISEDDEITLDIDAVATDAADLTVCVVVSNASVVDTVPSLRAVMRMSFV